MNKNLSQIQSELKDWTKYNFGEQESIIPIYGIIEEIGELTHAHLKELQNIRKSDFLADKADAIGDITIYLLNYFNCINVDISIIDKLSNIEFNTTDQKYINSIILKLNINIGKLSESTFYDSSYKSTNFDYTYPYLILYNLCAYTKCMELDFLTIVNETWEEVKLRDWKKFPLNGISK